MPDTNTMRSSMRSSIIPVVPRWRSSPFTLYHSTRSCGSFTSSFGMKSDTGLLEHCQLSVAEPKTATHHHVSKPFAAAHGSPFFFATSCIFRPV